jgi:hypothetical protein
VLTAFLLLPRMFRSPLAAFFALALHALAANVAWAQAQASASDATWLKLLHFEADSSSPSGWRSAVLSPEFFIDPQGAVSPERELVATLEGMQTPQAADADDAALNAHAQCRFPARLAWLKTRLPQVQSWPQARCPRWEAWRSKRPIESVSIVLATGYLGNPASYYGHALLKFNAAPQAGMSDLQQLSINYGALLTDHDDPLTYMAKGVFGGYEGGFSEIDYYHHRQQYGEVELRDLWEYQLNLSPDEAALVAAHAWEVLGRKYQYYFFKRNCAFRMAEIVQVIDGVDILPQNRPWTIPQSVLRRAASELRSDGRPLVKAVSYQPSRQSRYYARHQALDGQEAAVFKQLALNEITLADPAFANLPGDGRQAVLDTVIDYQQFVADPKARSTGELGPLYQQALAERYRLPPGQRAGSAPTPPPPHEGRAPGWWQVGAWQSQGTASMPGAFLRVRAAYYDPLDSDQGHIPNATLTMGDAQVHVSRQGLRVDHADLMAVESVNPGLTGLPGDRGEAWKLRLGWEAMKPGCQDCLTLRGQGDVGVGRQLSRHWFMGLYVGAALQDARLDFGHAFYRASSTVQWRSKALGLRAQAEQRWPVESVRRPYSVLRIEGRVALDRNLDLRLLQERSSGAMGGRVTTLGLGKYW